MFSQARLKDREWATGLRERDGGTRGGGTEEAAFQQTSAEVNCVFYAQVDYGDVVGWPD